MNALKELRDPMERGERFTLSNDSIFAIITISQFCSERGIGWSINHGTKREVFDSWSKFEQALSDMINELDLEIEQ